MTNPANNSFSAAEQALGYLYQSRFALYQLLKFPEEYAVLIEKEDDLDFNDEDGHKTLASLKHKVPGERVTDLSTDFWKSIRIWLTRYDSAGRISSHLRFFMYTTSEVADDSFLSLLLPLDRDIPTALSKAEEALSSSKSQIIMPIKTQFDLLSEDEKKDFFERIFIFDKSPRIEDLREHIISQHMRIIRLEFRQSAFERLEGWWNDLVIKLLTNGRTTEVYGHEISDKLSTINNEYKSDNLPIDFRGKKPDGDVDPENDPRLFVVQLRKIGISPNRIQNAIYDYYRAFSQRSLWARENVLLEGEISEYEDHLIEEWGRYRDVVFEKINDESSEEIMKEAGQELYKWAEFGTDNLRIRQQVSEAYVVRGNFHILANEHPAPRVYWHPLFLERLRYTLSEVSL